MHLCIIVCMPVCPLVVDIWQCCRAEHLANSVLIQCCGREHYNSQSPLAHRSNCIICSTGVIAHTSWSSALWASTQVFPLPGFCFLACFALMSLSTDWHFSYKEQNVCSNRVTRQCCSREYCFQRSQKIMVSWVCLNCCFQWITSLRIKVISIRGTGNMMAFLCFYPQLFLT